MEIWLDTIDEETILDGVRTGVVSGVTTNPSILSGARDVLATVRSLLDLQPGPVAVQVTAREAVGMVEEARYLAAFSSRLVVKIPVHREGLIAIEELKREGVPLLGTAVLFPHQALLAAHHEVAYLSPYFSHMGDHGDAFETLKTIVEVVRATGCSTQLLIASLRHLDHIVYCACLGVEGVTIKADLYHQLVAHHPVVEGFSERFLADWMGSHGRVSIKEALES